MENNEDILEEGTPESSLDDSEGNSEEQDTGENTNPERKNKSNWKNLSNTLKEERKARQEAELRAKELEEENNAWRSENPDIVKETLSKKDSKSIDKWELALFIAINPEAKEYLDDIKEFASEFNFKLDNEESLAKAWKFVKWNIPAESKSKTDFNLSNKTPKLPKDLTKVKLEDTGDMTPQQRAEWRKANWFSED